MNLHAFSDNWIAARRLCPAVGDRLKYLKWIYDLRRRAEPRHAQRDTIRFKLPPPVGAFTLEVRSNGGSDAFIFSEVFQHGYYDFELPKAPDTVLDLGGNAGFTALFFARKYPAARLAVVEPVPRNIEMLRANLSRNGIAADVIPKAIAIEDGFIIMETAPSDYGHRVADISFGRGLDGNRFEVPSISMRSLISHLGWDRIGLLKIDIEGYEGLLLREDAQWLACVDALCIECHKGFGERDLRELATIYGFSAPCQLPGIWLLTRLAACA